ncbi:MAG: hypothetical protein AOA65_0971 [Candidatus Bathyarchaeota archaeon BA1]|nr:MAG: hypothetical protein AOA65_0971 [Candidatus Bathyarchaeota archaeon BA1]
MRGRSRLFQPEYIPTIKTSISEREFRFPNYLVRLVVWDLGDGKVGSVIYVPFSVWGLLCDCEFAVCVSLGYAFNLCC